MFETFFNPILILIMVSVKCHNPVVIREDRVYRYIGNGSDNLLDLNATKQTLQTNATNEEIQQNIDNNQNESTLKPIIDEENIPESLLIQMKDINNASDFISSFLMKNSNPEHKDVYLNYLERDLMDSGNRETKQDMDVNQEKSKLIKLPKIGSPAGCIPEMKMIELKSNNLHNEIYFPSCIRIGRCSGCCPSQRLRCVPVNTSFEDITVIRVKYSPNEKRLKFEGFKVFRLEKHDKCNCDCIQKSTDCSPKQVYSEKECLCRCADTSEANDCQKDSIKYWDPKQCTCKCKSVPFCSTGLYFNDRTCRCESEDKSNNSEMDPSNSHSYERYRSLDAHRYVVDKRINSEIDIQNNKALDVFKVKGINPDIDEELHEKSDS